MNMGFDRCDRQDDLAQPRVEARLAWHAIRSRLAAGYAARRLLTFPPSPRGPQGSFNARAARIIAMLKERLGNVNRTASGDGKPRRDSVAAVAGVEPAGD
jgi:hypothetical protein